MRFKSNVYDFLNLAADTGPAMSTFEDPEDDEDEIVVLGPGEEAPKEEPAAEETDTVKLTSEQYKELLGKTDSTQTLSANFENLTKVLTEQQKPVANVQQQPGESEEEFSKRLEEDLWKPGKSAETLKRAVERIVGPIVAQNMATQSEYAKKLLKLDEDRGPIFKRYESEVNEIVNGLPAHQRTLPNVYEWAVDQVKVRHMKDLTQEDFEARFEEEAKKRGYVKNGEGKPQSESFDAAPQSVPNLSRKRKVYVTDADRRNAEVLGLDIKDYMRTRR